MNLSAPELETLYKQAVLSKLLEQYEAVGATVVQPSTIAGQAVDALIEQGQQRTALVLHSAGGSTPSPQALSRLRTLLREEGVALRVIFVEPPEQRQIYVDGLGERLQQHLHQHLPQAYRLVQALPDYQADGPLVDLQILNLHVQKAGVMELDLTANLAVQFASDDGLPLEEYLPFYVKLQYKADRVIALLDLAIDLHGYT